MRATLTARTRRWGPKIVLIAFVALALLLVLLRLAEFAGHRFRRHRPRVYPAAMIACRQCACLPEAHLQGRAGIERDTSCRMDVSR
ncbi:MAG: hypothetical protein WBM14_11345 [Terracidiphilus sp.]|jgi:hypothetical protein